MYQVVVKHLKLSVGDVYAQKKADGSVGRFKKIYLSSKYFPPNSSSRKKLIGQVKIATEKDLDLHSFLLEGVEFILKR